MDQIKCRRDYFIESSVRILIRRNIHLRVGSNVANVGNFNDVNGPERQ